MEDSFTNISSNLKHSLKGKNNTFFLVNDPTNELRQHYDKNYEKKLDPKVVIDSQLSKEKYLLEHKLNYGLFIIPDKSVVLEEKLPFTHNLPYRYTDELNGVAYDLKEVLDIEDYPKTDSHVSAISYLKIFSYILSKFNPEDYYFYKDLLTSLLDTINVRLEGDLLSEKNWSYDFDEYYEKYQFIDSKEFFLKPEVTELSQEVPEEFREFSSIKSHYYKNEKSFTEKKAVVLYDSKINYLLPVLTSYYREVFFYYDYNYFNRHVIEWFNPDDVIELRIERFLESLYYPTILLPFEVLVPIKARVEDMIILNDELISTLSAVDIRNMPVNAEVDVYIDDEYNSSGNFIDGKCVVHSDITGKSLEEHDIRFTVQAGKFSKSKNIFTKFKFYEDTTKHLHGLVRTLKGKDDTFFLVNDSNNEIRQHYDVNYERRFNTLNFILSQKSKEEYLQKKDIIYAFFVVPDKSVLLKDYLPVDTSNFTRYIPEIEDYVIDLMPILACGDYLVNDTHISKYSSLKVIPYVLSKLHGKSPEYYGDLLAERLKVIPGICEGNLFYDFNWSYDFDETYDKYVLYPIKEVMFEDSCYEVDSEEIPFEFRKFSKRESVYIKNPNSISDKKVLILHGSSAVNMRPAITAYYREAFFYWDHSYFSTDIIEWFKPDVIFEFRIERFFEKMYCPIIDENPVKIPLSITVNDLSVHDEKLNIDIFVKDLRWINVTSTCLLYIDGKLVERHDFKDGCCKFSCSIRDYANGEHEVRMIFEETDTTKCKEFDEKIVF